MTPKQAQKKSTGSARLEDFAVAAIKEVAPLTSLKMTNNIWRSKRQIGRARLSDNVESHTNGTTALEKVERHDGFAGAVIAVAATLQRRHTQNCKRQC